MIVALTQDWTLQRPRLTSYLHQTALPHTRWMFNYDELPTNGHCRASNGRSSLRRHNGCIRAPRDRTTTFCIYTILFLTHTHTWAKSSNTQPDPRSAQQSQKAISYYCQATISRLKPCFALFIYIFIYVCVHCASFSVSRTSSVFCWLLSVARVAIDAPTFRHVGTSAGSCLLIGDGGPKK